MRRTHLQIQDRKLALGKFRVYSKELALQDIHNEYPKSFISEYAGLFCMGIKKDISFSTVDFEIGVLAREMASNLILYATHILFRTGWLEIKKITIQRRWFHGLFKDNSYYFDLKSTFHHTDDFFLNKLISITSEFQGDRYPSTPLDSFVKRILNSYDTFSLDALSMIKQTLSYYEHDAVEISGIEKNKLLGLLKYTSFRFDDDFLQELTSTFSLLKQDLEEVIRTNSNYSDFVRSLKISIDDAIEQSEKENHLS